MSDMLDLDNWPTYSLTEIANYHNGFAFKPTDWAEDGVKIIRIEQLNNPEGQYDRYSGVYPSVNQIDNGDLIFSWSATLKVAIWNHGLAVLNQHLFRVNEKDGFDKEYIYYLLDSHMDSLAGGSHGSTMKHIKRGELQKYKVSVPALDYQRKIARILSTTDQAIASTEALIEKYQHIKAGLMHDLFTRGIGADGKLRPPREQAPELYKDSENNAIGWIPKEWKLKTVESVKESLVDGPFGSNLKTEHYVTDPGIRVVRLQNIQSAKYNDDDRAFISRKHANFLVRNKVVGNDILIAGLGEDRYPVGRACLYPEDLPSALNKADCFRLRCFKDEMVNNFVMYFLNTSAARNQVRRYEQGVTRPRINLGNLKKILIPKPKLKEQLLISNRLNELAHRMNIEISKKKKLELKKSGLMHDLLTGKVLVTPAPTAISND